MKQRKNVRRVLALVTAFVLLLGLVPFTATAESMTATLQLDTPLVVVGTVDDPALLYFTPEETGVYVCRSSDNEADPQVTLFVDDTDEELGYYDDHEGLQFYVAREFVAGVTYRFAVNARSSTEPFTVTLRKGVVPTAVEILGAEDGVLEVVLDGSYHTIDVAVTPANADFLPTLAWEDDTFGETYKDEFRTYKLGECKLTVTVADGASDSVTVRSALPPAVTEGDTVVEWNDGADGRVTHAFSFTAEGTAEYAFIFSNDDYYYEAELYELIDGEISFVDDTMGYGDLYMCTALEAGGTYIVSLSGWSSEANPSTLTIGKAVPATDIAFKEGDAATIVRDVVDEFYLTPVFVPLTAKSEAVTWRSSNEGVATVDEGCVSVIGTGVATIVAESESGLEATFTLTVTEPEAIVPDTEYTFEANAITGETVYTFTPVEDGYYNIILEGGEYSVWEGENHLFGGAEGFATYEFTAGAAYTFFVYTHDAAMLYVQKAPEAEAIDLEEGPIVMSITSWYGLGYELLPEGALSTGVVFSSSDETVLVVNDIGELYPLAPGTVTVTATLSNGDSDTVTVTVAEPIVWDALGTKRVILNPIFPEKVYRVVVPADGWYEFTADGGCRAEVELYETVDGVVEFKADAESEDGSILSLVCYLEADGTYYLQADADEELIAYDLTWRAAEEPEDDGTAEMPEEGIVLLDTEIAATVGDFVFPDYRLAEMEYIEEVRIEDEDVVVDDYGTLIAVGVGETTVTVVTNSGAEAEFTVTVTAAEALPLDVEQSIVLSDGVMGQGFAFTPETSGEYVFCTEGDCDTMIFLYDSMFNEITYNDDWFGYEAWLLTELAAGETYYVVYTVYSIDSEVTFTGTAALSVPATSLEILPDADTYLFFENGVYFAETYTGLEYDVKFGPSNAAVREDFYVETDNEECVEVWDGYEAYTVECGAATLTFTSESGLTATVKVQVIDPVLGDVNTDGVLDEADAALLLAHLQGTKDIGRRQYFAQMNDDEAIDMTDYILLLQSIESTEFPGVGDVNADGKTDSTDARLVLQYAVKKISGEAINLTFADVDGNGKVDSTDARLILQYAVKKIDEFPVTK